MPKKKRMHRKIYQQRNPEMQSKTYVWAELFFFLTCDPKNGFDSVSFRINFSPKHRSPYQDVTLLHTEDTA